MRVWGPWISEAVTFLDGDGTFRQWKYSGAYADQPALDISIYTIVRRKWVELVSEDRKAGR